MTGKVVEIFWKQFWQGLVKVKRYDVEVYKIPKYILEPKGDFDLSIMMSQIELNNYLLEIAAINWSNDDDPSLEEAIAESGLDEDDSFFSDGRYAVDMGDFAKLATQANAVVITYFWFIKTLKDICQEVDSSVCQEKFKSDAFHQGEMKAILAILDGKTAGTVSSQFYGCRIEHIMSEVKKIRNNYAHGNWVEVAKPLEGIRLKNVFEAISEFISGIEKTNAIPQEE